jgi:putative oxidoreductase
MMADPRSLGGASVVIPWPARMPVVAVAADSRGQDARHRTETENSMSTRTQSQTAFDTVSRAPADASQRGRARTIGLWVLQVVLAVEFGLAGLMKLAGTSQMVDMFDDIGVGQWFRVVVGVLEVAGAIGVLVPRLAWLAALGLAGVMAGAVVTTVFVLDANPAVPAVLLVVAALVARARRP